jgi:Mg-chelatase subunit ChlI
MDKVCMLKQRLGIERREDEERTNRQKCHSDKIRQTIRLTSQGQGQNQSQSQYQGPQRSDQSVNKTSVDKAAEKAAKEEEAEALKRRKARQYLRDFEARPPSIVDEHHLDEHITTDPVTHRPRRTLDPSYGYDRQSYGNRR